MQISQYLIVKKSGSKWSPRYSSRTTVNTPSLEANEVAIKINLTLPDAVFEKPAFEAEIVVPEDAVSKPVIEAETIDNVEKIIKQQTGFTVKLEAVTEEDDE